MEHFLKILWMKLLFFIGTEEQVYIRRRYRYFWDKMTNMAQTDPYEIIISGSISEGFTLPGSDIDAVCVIKDLLVLPTTSSDFHRPDIVMETDNIKPGSALLRVVNISNIPQGFRDSITECGNYLYLSSLFLRDDMVTVVMENNPDAFPHGPCTSLKLIGNVDFLYGLYCNEWPNVADEWIYRRRVNNWPSLELIEDIINDGCLLVPIGNSQSEYSFMEWRISFSGAERKLVHSMNHTQFLCYGLMKLYLKNVIESDKEIKDLEVLSSYFIKTCMFYCIEDECIVWEPQNLLACFWICFNRLFSWVRGGYCPNYFIKENNMFEGKIYGDTQRKLSVYLSNLYEIGNYTLTSIPCLSDLFDRSAVESVGRMTEDVITTVSECRCDELLFSVYGNLPWEPLHIQFEQLAYVQAQLPQATNNIDYLILKLIQFELHFLITLSLYKQISMINTSNKAKYRLQVMLKDYIIKHCTHHDICSGWLQYATLCYLTGNYNNVVLIAEYVLTKFRKHTVYYDCPPEYMSEICGRNYQVLQKMKQAFAYSYICTSECGMYPPEIEPVIQTYSVKERVWTPPVVYCYVLLFLSNNALGNMESRDITLDKFATVALDDNFVSKLDRPVAIALLEKCASLR